MHCLCIPIWYSCNVFHSAQYLCPLLCPLSGMIEVEMCALEFSKDHSVGLQDRPEDNVMLPQLLTELPRVNARTKERPFCAAYATKARILMHAHLSRLELSPQHSEGSGSQLRTVCACVYARIHDLKELVLP